MGWFSDSFSLKKNKLGGIIGLGGTLINRFNNPGIDGMSAEELRAIKEQKALQEARRLRLAQASYQRGRVAMGSIGGSRTLLYQPTGYAGANTDLGDQSPLGGI